MNIFLNNPEVIKRKKILENSFQIVIGKNPEMEIKNYLEVLSSNLANIVGLYLVNWENKHIINNILITNGRRN